MKKRIKKSIKRIKAFIAKAAPIAKAGVLKGLRLFHAFHTYIILAYVIVINAKIDDLAARLEAAFTAVGATMIMLLMTTAGMLGEVYGAVEKLLQLFSATHGA